MHIKYLLNTVSGFKMLWVVSDRDPAWKWLKQLGNVLYHIVQWGKRPPGAIQPGLWSWSISHFLDLAVALLEARQLLATTRAVKLLVHPQWKRKSKPLPNVEGNAFPSISLGQPRLPPSSWINISYQRSAPWQWAIAWVCEPIRGEEEWIMVMDSHESGFIFVARGRSHLCLSYMVWVEKFKYDYLNKIKIFLEKRKGEIDLVNAFSSGDHSWQRVDTQSLPALLCYFCKHQVSF